MDQLHGVGQGQAAHPGTDGFVGLLARSKSSTTFYRLALLPGQVQLQAVNSGAVTVLATSKQTVTPAPGTP